MSDDGGNPPWCRWQESQLPADSREVHEVPLFDDLPVLDAEREEPRHLERPTGGDDSPPRPLWSSGGDDAEHRSVILGDDVLNANRPVGHRFSESQHPLDDVVAADSVDADAELMRDDVWGEEFACYRLVPRVEEPLDVLSRDGGRASLSPSSAMVQP